MFNLNAFCNQIGFFWKKHIENFEKVRVFFDCKPAHWASSSTFEVTNFKIGSVIYLEQYFKIVKKILADDPPFGLYAEISARVTILKKQQKIHISFYRPGEVAPTSEKLFQDRFDIKL